LIGNVLQNSMQSEAAWVLLGTTVRLAQSKGLHKENAGAEYDDKTSILKRKIWWVITLSLLTIANSIM